MMDHTSLIPNVESNKEIIAVFPKIRFSIAIWFATYDYSMSSDPTVSEQRQRKAHCQCLKENYTHVSRSRCIVVVVAGMALDKQGMACHFERLLPYESFPKIFKWTIKFKLKN